MKTFSLLKAFKESVFFLEFLFKPPINKLSQTRTGISDLGTCNLVELNCNFIYLGGTPVVS